MNISEQASIKGDPQQVVSLMHTLLDECPVQSDLAQSDEGDAQRLCAADQGAAGAPPRVRSTGLVGALVSLLRRLFKSNGRGTEMDGNGSNSLYRFKATSFCECAHVVGPRVELLIKGHLV